MKWVDYMRDAIYVVDELTKEAETLLEHKKKMKNAKR
jgi:hypothetical protein